MDNSSSYVSCNVRISFFIYKECAINTIFFIVPFSIDNHTLSLFNIIILVVGVNWNAFKSFIWRDFYSLDFMFLKKFFFWKIVSICIANVCINSSCSDPKKLSTLTRLHFFDNIEIFVFLKYIWWICIKRL